MVQFWAILTYEVVGDTGSITDFLKDAVGEIEGKPVTGVGRYAFTKCSSLKSVTIPDRVTTFSFETFRECNRLTVSRCQTVS